MLGGLSGTILNYFDIVRGLAVSQPTARDYAEIAHGTFVWRRLPAYVWSPLKLPKAIPPGFCTSCVSPTSTHSWVIRPALYPHF